MAAAIEEARANYQDDLELQKVQAKAKARQQEEAEEFVRQEQDAGVQSGEFDQRDADSRRDSPEGSAARGSAKRRLALKAKKTSYALRGNQFLPAASVQLLDGEKLYWLRRRKFGQAAKFIAFGQVEKRKES